MNNKGFTLIEIISVVALLAIIIIITVPMIGKSSENVKKKTLQTKIDNIEKAAVLYGQDNRGSFTIENTQCDYCIDNDTSPSACEENNKYNGECYLSNCNCFNGTITVETLIKDERLKEDEIRKGNKVIVNPLDEGNTLNACKIQIYQKYGKIYAVYDSSTSSGETMCGES